MSNSKIEPVCKPQDKKRRLQRELNKTRQAQLEAEAELTRRFHPDLARTAVEQSYRTAMMAAVNRAYAGDDLQTLYDLAGELEPGEIAELAGIDSVAIRELRQEIMKARHRRRKALRQLTLLRQENTARLWRRAQLIEGRGRDYWSLLRCELQKAINRLELEVVELQAELERLGKT